MNEKKWSAIHGKQGWRLSLWVNKGKWSCSVSWGRGITRRGRWRKRGKNRLKINWTIWKIYTHHNLVCLLLLLLHFPFMNANFRCPSTVKYTKTHHHNLCMFRFIPSHNMFRPIILTIIRNRQSASTQGKLLQRRPPLNNWYITIL